MEADQFRESVYGMLEHLPEGGASRSVLDKLHTRLLSKGRESNRSDTTIPDVQQRRLHRRVRGCTI